MNAETPEAPLMLYSSPILSENGIGTAGYKFIIVGAFLRCLQTAKESSYFTCMRSNTYKRFGHMTFQSTNFIQYVRILHIWKSGSFVYFVAEAANV